MCEVMRKVVLPMAFFFIFKACSAFSQDNQPVTGQNEAPPKDARNVQPADGSQEVLDRDAKDAKLSARDQKMAVESVLLPYRAGHWDTVVQNVRKLLTRRELEEVEAVSRYLENGSRMSLAEILNHSRLQLGRSGVTNVPRPNGLESLLISRQLVSLIEQTLRDCRSTTLMGEPLEDPKDFLAYRDLIWERHVQSNELQNAMQLAKQGIALRRLAGNARPTNKDESLREELHEYDFLQHVSTIEALEREMAQRALEARVNRVNYALRVLEDAAAGTKDRLFAAYVIGVDSESLVREIRKEQGKFERPVLQDSALVRDLELKLKRGTGLGGDLIEKSRLLFAGLHWWRRGRYGMGTDAFGLLKSKSAMRDARLRLALMMPKTTPIPTDPLIFSANPVPDYQRRHLFFWAYEDRVFGKSAGGTSSRVAGQVTTVGKSPLANKHFDGMINGKFW